MDDSRIIELFFQRNQDAIVETRNKYEGYCFTIAYNVLGCVEDTQECVSDAYLKLWNSIPPTRPKCFRAFLGKVTHNLALDRYRKNKSRRNGNFTQILNEFDVSCLEEPGDMLARKELAAVISVFIRSQPRKKQKIFLLRYWYYESIHTISLMVGMKESSVKMELYRMRKKLRDYLEQEGYVL